MDHSTIAAIATPPGAGGIGIIRISGPEALAIATSLFQGAGRPAASELKSHRLYHGYIRDPKTGRVLDEVLLTLMRAPRTYTREDVAEIHAHSGPATLRAVLGLVLREGARLAEPGEFTKRAFLNGRIDLTQAEGVMDLISARTDRSLNLAAAQIRGGMKTDIEAIRNQMQGILTETEAAIDFPEDVGEEIDALAVLDRLENLIITPLRELVSRYDEGHMLRDGLQVVVAGRPNVGKSSLMNRLLRKERAIVTDVPGTTRDILEESLTLQGIPVVLTDTAGLHETDDPVEQIGIERAYSRLETADLVLFVTDASAPLTAQDHRIYDSVRHCPLIRVINKSDLVAGDVGPEIPAEWAAMPHVRISARYGQGIDALRALITDISLKDSLACESTVVPNLRHKVAIEASLDAVLAAADGIRDGIPFELVNIDIREALDLLGEVTGVTIREDVLDRIFSNFCIGK